MFDLCSGSGEPAVSIFKSSGLQGNLFLSDKYPGIHKKFENNIKYIDERTDALNHIFQPDHMYTMFNAFHHFNDREKLRIISSLRDSGAKGFFVEILRPGPLNILKILTATTIGTLILTPFVRPFSLSRFLLTYIIPVNIITITFDGLVSIIKSRSVKHYQALFKPMEQNVKVFKIKQGINPLTVIEIN
jgi:hypothetical protein